MDKSKLNSAQQEAVCHGAGPMMVLAGPGSGKTTVITYRVQYLIEEMLIPPQKILVITFTKSATEEMRKRFLALGTPGGERVTFSTFHAIFYRIIRARYDIPLDRILTDIERKEAVRQILLGMKKEIYEEFVAGVLNEISLVKNDLMDIRYYNSMNMSADDFRELCNRYEQFKAGLGKLDFDDMLVKCHDLFRTEPDTLAIWQNAFQYILIDEFQDINQAQYRCITMLAALHRNLFIVGDDDQSIYKFRGARPEFLLRFPDDFPDTARTVLDTNYRSAEVIIETCNRVIARNQVRYSKNMIGVGRSGPKPSVLVSADVNAEAMAIGAKIKELQKKGAELREIAVCYRTNMQARAFTDAFMNINIPYQVKDEISGIYEHWVTKDIYAYLRLSYDRGSNESLARILNKPTRYINRAVSASVLARGGMALDALLNTRSLKPWQRARLEEMVIHLNILTRLSAADACKYIRQKVGYDGYLKHVGEYRNFDPSGLYDILDELQEAAKPFAEPKDFAEHILLAADTAKEKKANAKRRKGSDGEDLVLLSTMHSVKGLEFETVFIASAVEGSIPYQLSKTEPEIEEERRLMYVGLTRAKTNLFVSVVKSRHEEQVQPTRFLNDILWPTPKPDKKRR